MNITQKVAEFLAKTEIRSGFWELISVAGFVSILVGLYLMTLVLMPKLAPGLVLFVVGICFCRVGFVRMMQAKRGR